MRNRVTGLRFLQAGKLLPNPRNWREHPPAQRAAMKQILEEVGFADAILARKTKNGKLVIVDGHLRADLDPKAKVPVLVLDVSEKEADRMLATLDPLAGMARANLEKLTALAGSQEWTGALGEMVAGVLAKATSAHRMDEGASPRDEAAEELARKYGVKPGQVWALEEHRVGVGDAQDPALWLRLARDGRSGKGAMVHTDPPYGVSYEAPGGKFTEIKGDEKRNDELAILLLKTFQLLAHHTTDEAAFYVWHASTTRDDFAHALSRAGLVERQYLVWVKPSAVLGRSDYRWAHEPCFYASKDGHPPAFYGDRTNETVWRVSARTKDGPAGIVGQGVLLQTGDGDAVFLTGRPPKGKRTVTFRLGLGETMTLATTTAAGSVWEIGRDHAAAHPTQKPVELPRRAIMNSSKPGQVVLDAFLGSGSTLIAAELTGRRCYGIELDPKYAAVTLDRWARTTKKEPRLLPAAAPAKAKRGAR